MQEGKKTATKPPVRKAPAALGETVKENEVTRRSFFSWLSLGWVGFVAATGGFFTMMLRFFFPNVLFEPVQTFRAGFPDDYIIGEVDTKWKDKYGVWMIRNDEGIYALSTICTHLGCTPNWLASAGNLNAPAMEVGSNQRGLILKGLRQDHWKGTVLC